MNAYHRHTINLRDDEEREVLALTKTGITIIDIFRAGILAKKRKLSTGKREKIILYRLRHVMLFYDRSKEGQQMDFSIRTITTSGTFSRSPAPIRQAFLGGANGGTE